MRILRLVFSISLLIVLSLGAVTPGYAQQGQQVDKIEISQVDGDKFPQVTLYVRILDADGKKVPGLTQDQFTITEDEKEVKITDFQTSNAGTIVTLMMLDRSGSMGQFSGKIEAAREAANTFVDLMRKDDLVSLWSFNHEYNRETGFTGDKDLLKSKIKVLNATGGTAWYDTLITTSDEITKQSGRRSILLLTDGMDEHSRSTFSAALDAAVKAQVPVYAIGLGQRGDLNRDQLQQLASDTGGKYYETPNASELKQLYAEISQSTQEEYVITYESPRATFDGTRRNINIKVGGATGESSVHEKHLLNIVSNPLVALIAALPLMALLFSPAVIRRIKPRQQVMPPQVPAPQYPPMDWQNNPPSAYPPPNLNAPCFCISCGAPLKPGARFCNTCGKPQVATAQQPVYGSQQVNQPANPPMYPPYPQQGAGQPDIRPQAAPPMVSAQQPVAAQPPVMQQPPVQQPPMVQPPGVQQPAPGGTPKFCSKCGNPLRPGVKFCSKCGARY